MRSNQAEKEPPTKSSFTSSPSRSSNFRRSQTNSGQSTRRKSSSANRSKSSRPRSYGYTAEPRTTVTRGRSTTPTRGRTTTRGRPRTTSDNFEYNYIPQFDGTITVTHQVPTEITIPIVNGQQTEYKNIITASISTEILGPEQYSTTTRAHNPNPVLVLASEVTSLVNGVTELTQFFLKETPTTSVTFTPTTIRGRRTSFSHIVPSTVYNVDPFVSTIQPQINANAPLANILLSQLLLGNLGLPNQQQPLLGLGQQQLPQIAATPTTEYKTRASTYVTTVTNGMSTVLTVTFHGKEILTTIVDSSVNVFTATEYITDTVVITPTPALSQPQQINSLLLPLLLQQQQQQQQNHQQTQQQQTLPNTLNVLNIPTGPGTANLDGSVSQSLFQDSLLGLDSEDRQSLVGKPKHTVIDDNHTEDYPDLEPYENEPFDVQPKKAASKKTFGRNKSTNRKPKPTTPTPVLQTEVITLYVSGRKPGEFSTVLSTVVSEATNSIVQKREIDPEYISGPGAAVNVEASDTPKSYDFYDAEGSDIDEFIIPLDGSNELTPIESSHDNERLIGASYGTQTLESVIGDVNKYVDLSTASNSNSAFVTATKSNKNQQVTVTKPINKNKKHFLF